MARSRWRGRSEYRLVYTRRAAKDIAALDPVTKRRLGRKLREYAASSDPLAHARRLSHAELGTYRFRVGDYRVVFDVRGRQIVVLRVGHRREIYGR